jgi:SH3-like domain-containing protein
MSPKRDSSFALDKVALCLSLWLPSGLALRLTGAHLIHIFPHFFLLSIFFIVTSAAEGLCISAQKANLRSGPSSKEPVSWVVGKYTPLLKTKSKGAWIQVEDVDGQTHWVHRRLVSYSMSCLTVKVQRSLLRTGPGKSFPLAKYRMASRYESFLKLDREVHWYKVKDAEGELAWIYDDHIWRPLKSVDITF